MLVGLGGLFRVEKEGRTLIATSTTCVLLAMPTTTEPCLTASAAYSTWNIRPCGELGERGVLAGGGRVRFWWRGLQCDRVVVVVVSEHGGVGNSVEGIVVSVDGRGRAGKR